MKIIRRTNILVTTERKRVVARQTPEPPIHCGECREPLMSAQMCADFFGFSSRVIYRLIESGKINFTEAETNEIYVCPVCIKE